MTETTPIAAGAGTRSTTIISTSMIIQPWRAFSDTKSFSLPASYNQSITRLNHNLRYFVSNYTTIAFSFLIIALYSHRFSVSDCIVSLLLLLLYNISLRQDLKHPVVFACDRVVLDRRLVIVVLSFLVLLVEVLNGAIRSFVCAIVLAAAVIGVHAVCRRTEDLFVDEEMARDEGLVVDFASQRTGQTPVRSNSD